jgi:hypothetical protein
MVAVGRIFFRAIAFCVRVSKFRVPDQKGDGNVGWHCWHGADAWHNGVVGDAQVANAVEAELQILWHVKATRRKNDFLVGLVHRHFAIAQHFDTPNLSPSRMTRFTCVLTRTVRISCAMTAYKNARAMLWRRPSLMIWFMRRLALAIWRIEDGAGWRHIRG